MRYAHTDEYYFFPADYDYTEFDYWDAMDWLEYQDYKKEALFKAIDDDYYLSDDYFRSTERKLSQKFKAKRNKLLTTGKVKPISNAGNQA